MIRTIARRQIKELAKLYEEDVMHGDKRLNAADIAQNLAARTDIEDLEVGVGVMYMIKYA